MREGQHSTLKYAIFSRFPAVILFGAVEILSRFLLENRILGGAT